MGGSGANGLKKITGESFSPGEDELLLVQNSVCSGCYNLSLTDDFMTASYYKTLNF